MCGAVVRNASSGVIKSPGYPFNYAHNLSCTWILEGAPGTHFKLQFDSMKIEYHYSCDYDILVVGLMFQFEILETMILKFFFRCLKQSQKNQLFFENMKNMLKITGSKRFDRRKSNN